MVLVNSPALHKSLRLFDFNHNSNIDYILSGDLCSGYAGIFIRLCALQAIISTRRTSGCHLISRWVNQGVYWGDLPHSTIEHEMIQRSYLTRIQSYLAEYSTIILKLREIESAYMQLIANTCRWCRLLLRWRWRSWLTMTSLPSSHAMVWGWFQCGDSHNAVRIYQISIMA